MLLSAGEGTALPLSPEEDTMDWTLEVDGPEVMIWEATTSSGACLQVSSAYSGSYAWSVHNSVG